MKISANSFDPQQYVHRDTSFHLIIGWSIYVLLTPLLIFYTFGLILVAWLILKIFSYSQTKRALARIKGSAVRVDEAQFPDIYQSTRSMAESMGLSECPDIYIIEDNKQNAFAVKYGSKRFILLVDDIVYGALATGNSNALNFIIAHELAHHALGHTGYMRGAVASTYLPLARIDEFSCDAVANAMVADPEAARDALALLLIGPQLFQNIDKRALDRQAREVNADKYSKKCEAKTTHPLLLRRYAAIVQ